LNKVLIFLYDRNWKDPVQEGKHSSKTNFITKPVHPNRTIMLSIATKLEQGLANHMKLIIALFVWLFLMTSKQDSKAVQMKMGRLKYNRTS
jgi:hypothetical protein